MEKDKKPMSELQAFINAIEPGLQKAEERLLNLKAKENQKKHQSGVTFSELRKKIGMIKNINVGKLNSDELVNAILQIATS